ncbi:MAG TPA: carboxypeptidase regulatory-like domain-containing protein [Bryobacteraceae bacterium]|nr:carboxypeptidase regulatory-like domain-containing protein [Bryobacteraceae bacterium]
MRRALALCILASACLAAANAQEVAGVGAVTGIVRDSSGEGIPDCTVLLANDALGIRRTMTTTDEGVFDAPALAPASGYSLKVSRKGFADWQIPGFSVSAGQTLTFRIPLDVEAPSAKIDPRSYISPVEDNKTGVSIQVSPHQVESLPRNGRALDTLVLLAPAVNSDRSSGAIAFRGELFPNSLLTDGLDSTNSFYFTKPGIGPQVSGDAIQEVQVLSSGWPAEIGHSMGGVVNAVTPSGTNTLHGTAYDYFHPGSWNSADRYAPGFNPAERQHQAGASVGGPILTDKLFGYVFGEAINGDSNAINHITNQLLANPFGTSVLASNCKANAAQCTAAINFINSQFNVPVARSLHSQEGVARIDYRFSEFHNFTVEANAMHRNAPNGAQPETVAPNGGLLGQNGNFGEETRYAKAGWTGILGAGIVNELRAGWYHDRDAVYTDTHLLPSTGLIGINVAGVPVGGANPAFPEIVSENRYQLVDNFTLTSYSHTLKVGADLSKNEDYFNQLYDRYGTYNYASLTTFAEDFSANPLGFRNYTNFTQGFGNPVTDLHSRRYQLYAQDTWKAGSRITVTFGVRWEKSHLPQPSEPNTNWYQTGTIPSANTDFAPRIGAAVMMDEKTVLRVGFGYYYAPYTGQLLDTLFADNGVYRSSITVNPVQSGSPVFPKLVSPSAIPTATTNVVFASAKFYNPLTEQGTAAIEHRFDRNTTVTLSYINSRGVKLWSEQDLNPSAPTITDSYNLLNAAGTQTGTYSTSIWTARDSTSFGHVYQIANEGKSRYSGFILEGRRRVTNGLSVQASYTRSTATDNIIGSPIYGFIPTNTIPANYGFDEGPSNFDQRNRGVINWTWQPTVGSGSPSTLRYVVNGWQLSGIATLASGMPQTPLVLTVGQQFTGVTMLYTTSFNGSGGWSRAPFVAVNSLSTGAQYNVDARLSRTLQFSDRVKAIVLIEAFNALNKQYNTGIENIAYAATSGTIRPVPGGGAPNASYGFPYGTNARSAQVAFRVVF